MKLTDIYPCERAAGEHRGRWIVQTYHASGLAYADDLCPHYATRAEARQSICASKCAMALRRKAVAIGPGSIMTDMLKGIMNDRAAEERILSRTPMGRCGEPEEVAAVAVFLASSESSYVTGQTIYPDGGRLGLNYTVPVRRD